MHDKTEFITVRLSPEEKLRIIKFAASVHMPPSVFTRQILLNHIDKESKKPRAKEQAS